MIHKFFKKKEIHKKIKKKLDFILRDISSEILLDLDKESLHQKVEEEMFKENDLKINIVSSITSLQTSYSMFNDVDDETDLYVNILEYDEL